MRVYKEVIKRINKYRLTQHVSSILDGLLAIEKEPVLMPVYTTGFFSDQTTEYGPQRKRWPSQTWLKENLLCQQQKPLSTNPSPVEVESSQKLLWTCLSVLLIMAFCRISNYCKDIHNVCLSVVRRLELVLLTLWGIASLIERRHWEL